MTVEAKNITKVFHSKKGRREVPVLKDSSMTVNSGELAAIFGRSGSGKTTLLNVLAGTVEPSGGEVLYEKNSIFSMTDKQLSVFRNENIGYIPQGQSALMALTVYENLILPTVISGGDASKKAELLLERTGLTPLRDAYPAELSGGELRRLAIARALINSPQVIFADEPTNDLDDENTWIVLELLREQVENGAAVVMVTHEQSALKYADAAYRMDGGVLSRETV